MGNSEFVRAQIQHSPIFEFLNTDQRKRVDPEVIEVNSDNLEKAATALARKRALHHNYFFKSSFEVADEIVTSLYKDSSLSNVEKGLRRKNLIREIEKVRKRKVR